MSGKFKPEKKTARVKKNFYMGKAAAEMLAELAEAYDTSQGKALDALISTYAPALLREHRQANTPGNETSGG